jgi:hypothetical protein
VVPSFPHLRVPVGGKGKWQQWAEVTGLLRF